jgi:GNAT superfamily N-acetyltransferase
MIGEELLAGDRRSTCLTLLAGRMLGSGARSAVRRSTLSVMGHPTGVVIRPLRRGDEVDLQANCMTSVSLAQILRHVEWAERERRPNWFEYLVAERQGEVVGAVTLKTAGSHALQDEFEGPVRMCVGRGRAVPSGDLAGWVVCGRLQRTGIGRALAEAVVDEARAWGMVRVEASTFNPIAEAAFLAMGFSEWGRLPQGAAGTEIFFHLDL